MPNSRPSAAPSHTAASASASAGEWRDALRRDLGAAVRLRCIGDAAAAVRSSPAHAREHLLEAALTLYDARDGALALRGERWQVLASRGRALPPGASLPGAWGGTPQDVVAARAGRGIDWWLGPQAQTHALEAAVALAGQSIGIVSLAVPAGRRDNHDDLHALTVIATLACALVAEPAVAHSATRRAETTRLSSLTRREREVLALLPRGLTNAAVAQELGMAPGTAKIHVERILHKLGLTDRTQAAVYAARHGMGA